ncbi:hypothetical protein MPL1032_30001 [Mesorhizobium plurifarium]|uniref:Uncharacterized protein n=1 Tax=Mesorhizobium plurifarium TaxID=69974 RepID=A0A0K2W2F7_MESPL|nr:hypothetical protein MPL1032_30001 [Mesorhizobium plurifarium]
MRHSRTNGYVTVPKVDFLCHLTLPFSPVNQSHD